jgi:Tol biopolymer transport system component
MFREVAAGLLILSALGAAGGRAADTVELVSRVDSHQASDTASGANPEHGTPQPLSPSLSADGRWVAFLSPAMNLVAGQKDVNGGKVDEIPEGADVFLADLTTGAVTLVSHRLGSPATTGNLGSIATAISPDGRWVAFVTAATDVAPGQRSTRQFNDYDLLLFDRVSGATTLVATDQRFGEGYFSSLSFSTDGRYLAFTGRGFLLPGQQGAEDNAYLYDRTDGSLRLFTRDPVSSLNGLGGGVAGMSADGRCTVVLSFEALLPGQPPQGATNAYLYDRVSSSLTLIGFAQAARISADGKYVALSQFPTALSLYSRETGGTVRVTDNAEPSSLGPVFSLSADGRYLAFNLFVPSGEVGQVAPTPEIYDRVSRALTAVGRAPGAAQPAPIAQSLTLSADGRYLVFATADDQQIAGQVDPHRPDFEELDVFLFDRTAGKTVLVSRTPSSAVTTGDGASSLPAISANGGRVVFTSKASNLLSGVADLNQAPDLYAWDVAHASLDVATGRAPDLPSLPPGSGSHVRALSADGRFVAFETDSANVVAGQVDANGKTDVFLYDATAKTTILVSHVPGSAVTAAAGTSSDPALSADGRWVAFTSNARNLVNGANPAGQPCVFLWDRTTGAMSFVAHGEAPRISPDGRWIAFTSFATDVVAGQRPSASPEGPFSNVFLWDRVGKTTTLVSHAASGGLLTASGDSDLPALSADGRFVAYHSQAVDLAAGQVDPGDPANDLFLFDRTTGTNVLVSHAAGSTTTPRGAITDPVLSTDGRYILFETAAHGLDPAGTADTFDLVFYLYDTTLKTYQQIGTDGGRAQRPSLSSDGRFAAFLSDRTLIPGTFGNTVQAYLYDRVAKTLTLVSHRSQDGLASSGYAGAPTLSADGRWLAFLSDGGGDLVAGLLPRPGSESDDPALFLYDRTANKVRLVSRWQGSAVTAGGGAAPFVSANGQRVAFDSADDLVYGDFNRRTDAYLFTLDTGTSGGPVTVPPCILFDSRRPADAPALRSNAARVVKATGLCGVPAGAKRVTIKLTVFQGTGKGNVRLYPGDLSAPSSGILRFSRGQTAAATFDSAVAPGAGTLTLLPFVAGNGTAGASVEVDGYTP